MGGLFLRAKPRIPYLDICVRVPRIRNTLPAYTSGKSHSDRSSVIPPDIFSIPRVTGVQKPQFVPGEFQCSFQLLYGFPVGSFHNMGVMVGRQVSNCRARIVNCFSNPVGFIPGLLTILIIFRIACTSSFESPFRSFGGSGMSPSTRQRCARFIGLFCDAAPLKPLAIILT